MAREAYRSLYGDLTKLKDNAGLQVSGSADDTALFQLLLAVSEAVDRHCGRHFYPLTAVRLFDGTGGARLVAPDLLAVTSLKADENEDKTFETTWASSDYWLEPYNAQPDKPWGGPFTSVLARAKGAKQSFLAGEQNYEVTGRWGYREYAEASGSLITDGGGISATITTINVTATADFAIGQTIMVETEQMLVTNISGGALTVRRALNGTTAATHALNTEISIVRWPAAVERAAIINTSRIWSRAPVFEPFYVDADLDTDVRLMLEGYVRRG